LQLVYGTSKIQEIQSAQVIGNLLTVELKDGIKVLFPQEGDRDFILGSLTLILSELKKDDMEANIEDRQFEIIDLRYKNPVLR